WYSSDENYNLFRSFQFTYSFLDYLEAGLNLSITGLPTKKYSFYTYAPNYLSEHLTLSLQGIGLYAVGVLKPFQEEIPDWVYISVGGGPGMSKMNFSQSVSRGYDSTYEVNVQNKFQLSGILFAELGLISEKKMSISLIADYIVFPEKLQIPEISEIGQKKKYFDMSSFTWGISFGFHF
ncbi:MAG: hypothetical protein WCT77_06215, partial [Bacteroidota bacterium]